MNQIFRIAKNEIHIDSLALELTASCAKNCKGCYLKKHPLQAKEIDWQEWVGIFNAFFHPGNKNYSCNQISISVNEREKNSPFKAMSAILFLNHFTRQEEKVRTKIHFTIFSPSTILQYKLPKNGHYIFDPIFFFSQVDSIYFSNISGNEDLNIISELRGLNKNLEIGWNATAGISKPNENMVESNNIDGIYSVVNKAENNQMFSFETKKAIQDTCWIDYNNWKKDWHNTTCSAGISRFTVWPDGSVSGCPYSGVNGELSSSNTKPANDMEGIFTNILEASRTYDFNECPLKRIYK